MIGIIVWHLPMLQTRHVVNNTVVSNTSSTCTLRIAKWPWSVQIMSRITAVEESDGRGSSYGPKMIVIASNQRHWATTPTEPWCSSVAEHWRLKPEALGFTPNGNTFLSSPLSYQRSTDSDGPDCAFDETWSRSVFGPYEESRPSDSSTAVILLMICTLQL